MTLGLSACQQEDIISDVVPEGTEVEVCMSTSMPETLTTYAQGSDLSGLVNLEKEGGYYVRYIMEIYLTKNGTTTRVGRQIKYEPINDSKAYKNETFDTVRLLANRYSFAFWADIVKEIPLNSFLYSDSKNELQQLMQGEGVEDVSKVYGSVYFVSDIKGSTLYSGTNHTDFSVWSAADLQEISYASQLGDQILSKTLSPEAYDAYTAVQDIDLRTQSGSQNIVLKRPFAKLRIQTTDAEVLDSDDYTGYTPSASLTIPTKILNTFNALTNQVVEVEQNQMFIKSISHPNMPDYENDAVETDADGNVISKTKTIGVYYLFIPSSNTAGISSSVDFSVGLNYNGILVTGTPRKYTVDNVPFQNNKVTTIKGNLLSANANISITIDDEFDGTAGEDIVIEEIEVSNINDLKAKLNGKSQKITYTGKITKDNPFSLDLSVANNTLRSSEGTPLYSEGNDADIELVFTNIEEGAHLSISSSDKTNEPRSLKITNTSNNKSILIVNVFDTTVKLSGGKYSQCFLHGSAAASAAPYNTATIDIMFSNMPALNGDKVSHFFSVYNSESTKAFHLRLKKCSGTCGEAANCEVYKKLVVIDASYSMLQFVNGEVPSETLTAAGF